MIARILIRQLYDTYNYDIQFPENQRVTIITGPNGYGKTTFLKICLLYTSDAADE